MWMLIFTLKKNLHYVHRDLRRSFEKYDLHDGKLMEFSQLYGYLFYLSVWCSLRDIVNTTFFLPTEYNSVFI